MTLTVDPILCSFVRWQMRLIVCAMFTDIRTTGRLILEESRHMTWEVCRPSHFAYQFSTSPALLILLLLLLLL